MSPEFGQTWFRVAFFITLLSAIVLLFQKPGTAEFIVTLCGLGTGLIMIAIIAILVKKSR